MLVPGLISQSMNDLLSLNFSVSCACLIASVILIFPVARQNSTNKACGTPGTTRPSADMASGVATGAPTELAALLPTPPLKGASCSASTESEASYSSRLGHLL